MRLRPDSVSGERRSERLAGRVFFAGSFMRAFCVLSVFLCCLVCKSRRAGGVPLLEKAEHFMVLDGSLKSFFFGVHMPFHSPELLNFMGWNEDRGAMALVDVRLKLEGTHKNRWKWQMHMRSQGLASSFPNAMDAMGTAGSARPPRSLPMQTYRPDDPTFSLYHDIDRLNVRYRTGPVDIILGRQPISFGVGFVWQPVDLVGTFSPLEVDREYKPGVDALRVNWMIGMFTEMSFVAAIAGPACRGGSLPSGESCHDYMPRFTLEHSVALARYRTTVDKWDLGILGGWVRGDVVGGVFVTGAVKRFRFRSEAVVTWDIERDTRYAGDGGSNEGEVFVRAVLGADYNFDTEKPLSLLVELYYNGFGTRKTEEYLTRMQQPRVAEFGEVVNVGLFYAAMGGRWQPHERVELTFTAMANLMDPSVHISGAMTYRVSDNSVLSCGALVPVGKSPKINALGFPEIQSEFGFYPHLYYLAWKMYF